MAQKFWTSSNGDQFVQPSDLEGLTETGQALLSAENAEAAAEVIAPGSTVLSAAATAAIAALTSESTAAQIVAALQAS